MGVQGHLRQAATEQNTAVENLRGMVHNQQQVVNGSVQRLDSNPLQPLHHAAADNNQP